MEGRGANGWSCGSISNKCNWLPFKCLIFFSFLLVLQAQLPPTVSCPVLWAEGVPRRNRKWVGTHTHGLPCVTAGALHTLTVSALSWSLLKLWRLGQLVFVKSLMSHLDWWLGSVCKCTVCVCLQAEWWWHTDQRFMWFPAIRRLHEKLARVGCRVGTFEDDKPPNTVIRNTKSCLAGQR